MDFKSVLILLCFCTQNSLVDSSHFRGATFSWKSLPEQNHVEIEWRIFWRRSMCDETSILNRELISGSGNLVCTGCSSGISLRLSYYCTDFSLDENWMNGVNSITIVEANPIFKMKFSGGGWISEVGGGHWSFQMSVDLTTRSDIGRSNSSPFTSISPIVRLKYGCNHSISIPVEDPDGDVTRCRYATGTEECWSICDNFPDAILDENACEIHYRPTNTSVSWFAVALMIEDFSSAESTTPLSKIPIQFLVYVFNSTGSCDTIPQYVDPTPLDGACVNVPLNETYFEKIVIYSENSTIGDVYIDTVSPLGFIKSEVKPLVDQPYHFYVDVSWDPQDEQLGDNIFCFTAYTGTGGNARSCITLVVGELPLSPPLVVPESLFPRNGSEVFLTQSQWSFEFDKDFDRPKSRKFLRFYDIKDNLIYSTSNFTYYATSNTSVEVVTDDLELVEAQEYYILMDAGVAREVSGCDIESPAISDATFWQFFTTILIPDVNVLDATVKLGEDATISCTYTIHDGRTLGAVVWYNSTSIGTQLNTLINSATNPNPNGRYSIDTSTQAGVATLTISNALLTDLGFYQCSIVDSGFYRNNDFASLTVQYKPDFHLAEEAIVGPGVDVVIAPEVSANPNDIIYQWSTDHFGIDDTDNNPETFTVSVPYVNVTMFTITVNVINSIGSTTKSVKITVARPSCNKQCKNGGTCGIINNVEECECPSSFDGEYCDINTTNSNYIGLTIGMLFVGIFVGVFGLFAGIVGYMTIKQKTLVDKRSMDNRKQDKKLTDKTSMDKRKQDPYMEYRADTGNVNLTYEEDVQQKEEEEATYVNVKPGKNKK